MPDLVRLRYVGEAPVTVAVLGRPVESDHIVDFPGKVVEEQDDCYLIETGNPPELRAWPKSLWLDETVKVDE